MLITCAFDLPAQARKQVVPLDARDFQVAFLDVAVASNVVRNAGKLSRDFLIVG